jgi:hypothetical protein
MDGDGAAAVLEAPVSTDSTQETPVGTSQPDKTQEPTQSTQPDDKNDRRQQPDALRKYLAAQRAVPENAEHVKTIERALGELKSWKTVAPTVREAREIKQALDSVGGREKLAEMQTRDTQVREVDSLIAAGDERVLPMILQTPEDRAGIAKILPGLLRELGKSNASEVSAALQPHISSYLDSQGLPEAIDAMVAAFNENKPDQAKSILAKIVNWGKNVFGAKGTDSKPPEQAAWETEREQFHQREFAGSVKTTFDAAMTHAEQAIDKELGVQAKEYGLTPEVLAIIRADVWKRIEKERNNDPLFKSTIASKVNERTRKVDPTTADYLKSQTDQRVKDAVRLELRARYGFIKKAPVDPNKKPDVTAAPGGVTVSIDYPKTIAKFGGRKAAEDAIMNGEAVNSAGKNIVKQGKVWKLA